jgi:hypothetical protein
MTEFVRKKHNLPTFVKTWDNVEDALEEKGGFLALLG